MNKPPTDPLPLRTKTPWGLIMSVRVERGERHYVIVEPRCVSVIPAEVVEAMVAQLENQRSAEAPVRETQESSDV